MVIMYDFWGFSDDNTRFEVNSSALWLITRKILGQNVSKYPIGMFYVVSDGYSTEHTGWELNKGNTHIHYDFVQVTPEIHKSHPWLLFLIKIQLEMKFLWSDLSSSSSIMKKIEDPIIMLHLSRLNQNRISLNFWPQKWLFLAKLQKSFWPPIHFPNVWQLIFKVLFTNPLFTQSLLTFLQIPIKTYTTHLNGTTTTST